MQLAIVASVFLIAAGKIVVEAVYWEDFPSEYTESGQEYYSLPSLSSSPSNYKNYNQGYLPPPSYDDLPHPNHKQSSSRKKNFKLEYDGRIIEFPSGRGKSKEALTKDEDEEYPTVKVNTRFGSSKSEDDEEFVSRPAKSVYKKSSSEKYWKSPLIKRIKYKKYNSKESNSKPTLEYDETSDYDNDRLKKKKKRKNRKYKNSEDTGSFIKREDQYESPDESEFEVKNRFDFDSSLDEFQESSKTPRRKFNSRRYKNEGDSFSSSNDDRRLEEEEHDGYEDSRDMVRNKYKSLENDEEESYVKRNKFNYKPKHSRSVKRALSNE